MKLLTNFFSSAATKRPVITILVVVLLTGFFGYMAGQAEELSTSFGGELDTPEIQAQSKLGEYFPNIRFTISFPNYSKWGRCSYC